MVQGLTPRDAHHTRASTTADLTDSLKEITLWGTRGSPAHLHHVEVRLEDRPRDQVTGLSGDLLTPVGRRLKTRFETISNVQNEKAKDFIAVPALLLVPESPSTISIAQNSEAPFSIRHQTSEHPLASSV